MKKFLLLLTFSLTLIADENLSPGPVGWVNLLVPGAGATLRGEPGRGLLEASLELGTFFGGTFGAHEGAFNIDSTVALPENGSRQGPIIGTMLQQFGLKFHMYNTFYHYQQASIVSSHLVETNKAQPLYMGDWSDILSAPFRWKYLSSPWVYGLVGLASAGIAVQYAVSPIQKSAPPPATRTEDFLYGTSQIAVIPLGGCIGEEAFFRGFVQREFHVYTGSEVFAILGSSLLFTAIHPPDLMPTAFLSGLYFGWLTDYFDGDLGPALAAHFWVNVVSGLFDYWTFLKAEGKSAPFSPPITMSLAFRF